MSKLPITFQQGKAFLIVGDVPEKLSEKYFSGDQWKESNYFRKYREAISVLPRLEIVNAEVLKDMFAFKADWLQHPIDGDIYFVDGEYTTEEIETVEDGGGCFVAGVKTVARITLSNTTEQKNDASNPPFAKHDESFGDYFKRGMKSIVGEVEASVEEKGMTQDQNDLLESYLDFIDDQYLMNFNKGFIDMGELQKRTRAAAESLISKIIQRKKS
jgi:hypothetical protein